MKSILIIDDDDDILGPIQEFYDKQSITTYIASSGTAGMQSAIKYQPDVIVCDVVLPDTDGFELYESLQEVQDMSEKVFILISGTTDREFIRRGMQLGIDDYLTKPFTIAELQDAINVRIQRTHKLKSKYDTTITNLRRNITYALPHEMRTPLMGLLGYAQLLEENAEGFTVEEIESFASAMLDSGYRLQHVIENYLVYSQLEVISGDEKRIRELRNQITRATPIIEKITLEIAERYRREADLDSQFVSCALRISKENLNKIVNELVDNAFKFSEPGTPVLVRLVRQDSHFILQIRDYGRGMTQDQLDQIGAFMQFDRVLHEQQGLGLGLALSRRLVELHGGNFEIISQPDKGTLVRIEFTNDG